MPSQEEISLAKLAIEKNYLSQEKVANILLHQTRQEYLGKSSSFLDFVQSKKILSLKQIAELKKHATTQVTTKVFEVNCGSLFGHYRIEKLLGQGGMGVVYKALDTKLQRQVAIKLINTQVITKEKLQRFVLEARATASFRDPGIVEVFEIGERPQHYFAMEYIEGETLANRIKNSKLTFQEIATIIQKVSQTLYSVHKKNLIHRDIKPSNIMMIGNNPKLMDFGLVKYLGAHFSLTGSVLGTPAYMSPEQLQGKEISIHSDIYSLGATLYEVLAGTPPFQGGSHVNIAVQILEKDPIFLSTLNPDIPIDLVAICHTCLAKNPRQRYPNAKILAQDLKNFIHGRSISVSPPSKVSHLKNFMWRYKAAFALSMVIFITLLTIIFLLIYFQEKRLYFSKQKSKEVLQANKKEKTELNKVLVERKNSAKVTQVVLVALNKIYQRYEDFYEHPVQLYTLEQIFNSLEKAKALNSLLYGKHGKEIQKLYYLVQENKLTPNTKEIEENISKYTKMILSNPGNARNYNKRGFYYYQQQNYPKALADFNTCLKLNSNMAGAYLNRGIWYTFHKKEQKAKQDLHKAHLLNPNFAQYFAKKGGDYYRQKNLLLAKQQLSIAITLNPKNASAYLNLARIYCLEKKENQVLHYLQLGIKYSYQEIEKIAKDSDFEFIVNKPSFKKLFK